MKPATIAVLHESWILHVPRRYLVDPTKHNAAAYECIKDLLTHYPDDVVLPDDMWMEVSGINIKTINQQLAADIAEATRVTDKD